MQLGFRNYFILKRYRFLTAVIFIGSASIVHKGGFPVMAETTRKLAASTR